MVEVCCVTGLVTEVGGGADVDATLLGGLGRDGKNVFDSGVAPFGKTVAPFAAGDGRVGEPALEERKERNKINLFYFNSHDTIWHRRHLHGRDFRLLEKSIYTRHWVR